MSEPGVLRRAVLCRLQLCQTFTTQSDDTGVWGECVKCGKRAGFVSREYLRRYAEAEERDARAKSALTPQESSHDAR